MAKRYSKYYSNYILKKKYQYTTKGTIWERDWVTIGAQHQIEKGKRPFYGDSGFLFTDNSIPDRQKRHDFGKIVGIWTYDDVYSTTPIVNVVKLNYKSNDLRDFAYYGSCAELIRTSVLNIIKTFPACIIRTGQYLTEDIRLYRLYNPFGIDLITEDVHNEEVVNMHRYVSKMWGDYRLIVSSNYEEPVQILGYNVSRFYHKLDAETEEADASTIITADAYNNLNPENKKKYGLVNECLAIQKLGEVTFDAENDKDYTVTAYLCNGEIIYVTADDTLTEIRPSSNVIEEYFYNIDDFEGLLLRRDTLPIYTNSFLKMFDTERGTRYAYRTYTWPRINDYCIDIESPLYLSYVNDLTETAMEMDEVWCDNIWNKMTHEAIKNYDWTYTREYSNDELENFVDGGNRVEKVIRIYGRVFDDLKRYIDGIRFSANVTYDGFNNMPDAEISDRLEYNGWEIYSTIPSFDPDDDLSTVFITNEYLLNNDYKWFLSANNEEVTSATSDISFLRNLALSSKYLLKSKGTLKGIDMVMSMFGIRPDEYSIEEQYLTVEMKHKYAIPTDNNAFAGKEKAIADLVHYDNVSWFYDDPYEGVPFGNVELYNNNFIIPFYDHSKQYLGELAFQGRGGWYKKSLDVMERNDYEETLSYLNVVPNFNALLNVNTYALSNSEETRWRDENIYYVVDPSDYAEYNEGLPYGLNHYFYCNNIYNPELPASWDPILQYIVDPNEENWITAEEYGNLPLYTKKDNSLEILGVNSLPSGLVLPNDITAENLDAYLALGYVYVCNRQIVKIATEEEYENVDLGYNTQHDKCDVRPNDMLTYKCKFRLPNNPLSPPVLYFDGEVMANTMSFFNEISDGIYNSELGYVSSSLIRFEGVQIVTYDEWNTFSEEKQQQYSFDFSSFDEALHDRVRYFDTTHNFDLRELFEDWSKLKQSDYISLKSLYRKLADEYIQIDSNTYAPKTDGDVQLWERAVYLDNIISSSIGNNPHVGYGNYDLGNEFFEYMTRPFKYYTDNYNLPEDVRNEMDEEYTFILSDPYSAMRWGRVEKSEKQPYLVNTGWGEQVNTVDGETTYVYTKNGECLRKNRSLCEQMTLYDGKVKNISNTYRYTDGYYKIKDNGGVKRVDWTVPYTENVTNDGYVYTKTLNIQQYEQLPASERGKWDENMNEGGLVYYVLHTPFVSDVRRTDLTRGWYEYEIMDIERYNYRYRKDITKEEYNALPSYSDNPGLEPDTDKDWSSTIVKFNSFGKYTDEQDEIDNSIVPHYYLNSKLFIMRLKTDNRGFFRQYFLDVIGKYVMQMIPSTAITVFLFEENDVNGN